MTISGKASGLVSTMAQAEAKEDAVSYNSAISACDKDEGWQKALRFGGVQSDACDGSTSKPNDIVLYSKSMTIEEIRTAPVIIPAGAINQVVENLKCAICKEQLGRTELMLELLPKERVCQYCEGEGDYGYDEEADYSDVESYVLRDSYCEGNYGEDCYA